MLLVDFLLLSVISLNSTRTSHSVSENLNFLTLVRTSLCRPQRFPLQVTGWPLEMMAYAYLVVSPPEMSRKYDEV